MLTVLAAAGLLLLAELGDKTQLVVLTLDARRSLTATIAALAVAIAGLQAVAVLVGAGLGAVLPAAPLAVAGGLLFLAFAVWAWRSAEHADEHHADAGRTTLTRLVGAFVLAELGDKSSLATAALATQESPLLVWAGATVGFLAATVLVLLAGRWLRARLGARLLTRLGAVGFAVAGVLTLGVALIG